LKRTVPVAQENSDVAARALVGALATVGHDQISLPIFVHIADRDRVGIVSPGGIALSGLKGSIPISQQHTYCAAIAIVLRTLIGHGQIEVPISIEVANRDRKGVRAPGKVGFRIEENLVAI
jgi:hypothetical protein